ncbi:pre-mRNA-splicing factor ATP-dependent RNA helicase Prp22p [Diutina catenulata]
MQPEVLRPLILEYLGIEDTELTVANFITQLLQQSTSLDSFRRLIQENGGDEFPQEFLGKCFFAYKRSGSKETKPETESAVSSALGMANELPQSAPKREKREFGASNASEGPKKPEPSRESHNPQSKLQVGEVYRGTVSKITTFGAFIQIKSPDVRPQSGLCHISQMANRRISSPQVVVSQNQTVFVRVLAVEPKLSLSMKNIDQVTGLAIEDEDRGRKAHHESAPKRRRLTSPERWEICQLIAAGAAKASDYPELDQPEEDDTDQTTSSGVEVEIDIHLKQETPKFLKGEQIVPLNQPAKIKRQPEGSLERVALNGSKFATEFRDERKQQDKQHPGGATETVIAEWRKQQQRVKNVPTQKLSMDEQRKRLPVYAMRQQIVDTVRDNQFLVVVGETGSGKTTQIVQYLYEEGLDNGKRIGCTQPRRVAAQSVAKRVAQEMGTSVGDTVGYLVRFDDCTSRKTVVKYMTDGMLQREALKDTDMTQYSVIMLDEAHERTIATDILFALLKKAAAANPNLKVICTSATLDAEKFSRYFNSCPILKIPGRTFPVDIMYTKQPELDYVAAVLDSIVQIHVSEPLGGDILVFLTGQDEIDTCCEALFERLKVLGNGAPPLLVLPIYSALPADMQARIFDPCPPGSRKVVIATNIAETSITIDGILYVIDPGFVKLNSYDAKLGMDTLKVTPISQAQANQRSGRAGRTGPGKCFRLYTERAFVSEMAANSTPEIQRQNLSHTILMLKAMGIHNMLTFDFMDPPPKSAMILALNDLYILGALDEDGYLTELGRRMTDFPMEPALAKTLIVSSVDYHCSAEMISIVAMLSVQNIWFRPKDKAAAADQRKARFHNSQSDHLTLLNVYRGWELNDRSTRWCQENYIQERSMRRAYDVRKQLVSIMDRSKQPILSCGSDLDSIRRAIVAGFFKHSAKRDRYEGYRTVAEQNPVFIHPSSCLFGKHPEYVVYHSLLLTTREYMHCATEIKPQWLSEAAPHYFGITDAASLHQKKRAEKITPIRDGGWRLSAQAEKKRKALQNPDNSHI